MDIILPEGVKPEVEKTVEENVESLSLPRVEGPTMEFNREKKMFWIGFPVDKIRPFEATLALDSFKLEYYKAFIELAAMYQEKIQKASPGVLNNLRRNFLLKNKKA
jgi:hypothetical protein